MSGERMLIFKVVLCGQRNVGKTSLARRYVDGYFTSTLPTLGVDFSLKKCTITLKDEKEVKVAAQIWDIAGEERFRSILPYYAKGSNGVIFMFSLTDPKSLDNLVEWINVLYSYLPREKVPAILVGGKSDLDSELISEERILKFVEEHGLIGYISTSSFEGTNVGKVFNDLATTIAKKILD